jgi:hypothetical protein
VESFVSEGKAYWLVMQLCSLGAGLMVVLISVIEHHRCRSSNLLHRSTIVEPILEV